jgi:hypothetical protein
VVGAVLLEAAAHRFRLGSVDAVDADGPAAVVHLLLPGADVSAGHVGVDEFEEAAGPGGGVTDRGGGGWCVGAGDGVVAGHGVAGGVVVRKLMWMWPRSVELWRASATPEDGER